MFSLSLHVQALQTESCQSDVSGQEGQHGRGFPVASCLEEQDAA